MVDRTAGFAADAITIRELAAIRSVVVSNRLIWLSVEEYGFDRDVAAVQSDAFARLLDAHGLRPQKTGWRHCLWKFFHLSGP